MHTSYRMLAQGQKKLERFGVNVPAPQRAIAATGGKTCASELPGKVGPLGLKMVLSTGFLVLGRAGGIKGTHQHISAHQDTSGIIYFI